MIKAKSSGFKAAWRQLIMAIFATAMPSQKMPEMKTDRRRLWKMSPNKRTQP